MFCYNYKCFFDIASFLMSNCAALTGFIFANIFSRAGHSLFCTSFLRHFFSVSCPAL